MVDFNAPHVFFVIYTRQDAHCTVHAHDPPACTSRGPSVQTLFPDVFLAMPCSLRQGSSGGAASSKNLRCDKCSGCGVKTAPSGTFEESESGQNYKDNSNCEWIIAPSDATSLTLRFDTFNTESGYDKVTVYRCDTVKCDKREPLLEGKSGLESGLEMTSETGIMQVLFTSDGSVTRTGFVASWTSKIAVKALVRPRQSFRASAWRHRMLRV